MARYDTNDRWEDPFEPRQERRVAKRFAAPLQVKIAVHDSKLKCRLVCRGNVMNISRVGALVRTRHQVEPGMRISIAIPTKSTKDSVCLPKVFVGSADVIRVTAEGDGISVVALRFGTELAQNMEFALFTDALYGQFSPRVEV
ncbi:MAG: PilZ domain-containing protein [Candidatus Hydrogenedentales bacterium]